MGSMGFLADHVEFGSVDWLRSHGLRIALLLAVGVVVTVVARLAVRRLRRRLEGTPSVTQAINLQRVTTITHTASSAVLVLIWSIALLLVLGEFDVDLAPLLAGAGIAGVALGFGAQSIVRDALSGFFILFENQFGVGDVIEAKTTAGPVSGKVESLTLRITSRRAFDGTFHNNPNGNNQLISNRSRGWARAIVDIRIGYGENVEKVREILEELFEELRLEDDLRESLRDGPSVLGIETLAAHAVVVRIIADTRPSRRWDVERQLRERVAHRLRERGVQVPLPPQMVTETGETAGTTPRPSQ
ncbi:MAG: mechanosensitive ion channel family protein [Actinomycetota bacterium]